MGQTITRPNLPKRSPSLADRLFSRSAMSNLLRKKPSASSLSTPVSPTEMESPIWSALDLTTSQADDLVQLHYGFKVIFDEKLYLAPIELSRPVEPHDGQNLVSSGIKYAKVLDIGCGPGTWLMEVAVENPRIRCVGLDASAIFPTTVAPSNCCFALADILSPESIFTSTTLGCDLVSPTSMFDFIHIRCFLTTMAVDTWRPLLNELTHRRLAATGFLELIEASGVIHGFASGCESTSVLSQWIQQIYNEDLHLNGEDVDTAIYNQLSQTFMDSASSESVQWSQKQITRIFIPLNPNVTVENSDSNSVILSSQPISRVVGENLRWLFMKMGRRAHAKGLVADMDQVDKIVDRWYKVERLRSDAGWVQLSCCWGQKC